MIKLDSVLSFFEIYYLSTFKDWKKNKYVDLLNLIFNPFILVYLAFLPECKWRFCNPSAEFSI